MRVLDAVIILVALLEWFVGLGLIAGWVRLRQLMAHWRELVLEVEQTLAHAARKLVASEQALDRAESIHRKADARERELRGAPPKPRYTPRR